MQKPAVALAAAVGRRKWTVETAKQLEAAGFAGIYCASFGDGMGLCLSIAHATSTIKFGTSIIPIYYRVPFDLAQSAAYIHEIGDGRFYLGIGVSHEPANQRIGVKTGKPLSDMRRYVEAMRAAAPQVGPLPPIVLATLRKKMVELAVEIAEGAVWANAARSHMPESLSHIPQEKREGDFFIGDMIPMCIDDEDPAAAANVMRRVLTGYVMLPNYRNYWKEAGYVEEMEAIEAALARGDREALPGLMSDRWLADCTLFGTRKQVFEGLEQWYAAGVKTPIVVPSSTKGGQVKAFEELFAAFA
ncbi:LLM class flavin-dependent oxidoreductase [Tepidiforma thermophila]|uniref:Alkanesulfonate monooxygenase SsuD/methylene tetrahydromethanopterin reductase-like flavin-dependent oxidoreductase (Luciferase family) n=1 Tax=Tepidiforma thermophila (strain KCTC 52669 / CGMCC 1.13589 / G233) TaxID=2761530 RepID=A0A2A9HHR9_TEPT2|nr:LLM class flavin-dependent oxidoreductase [Tepidiforma thermophila]PFG74913.1 alkanesulfonate monooxygenase SsuD/methylene tetrahydromethanopterin reductase-like flavin-dependent oxidoreductase (luciferase family) [Tepidiforma thermophila]